MKIKKVIHEIPDDIIDMNQLDQINLHFFKVFSLPVWLVIISIGLSFIAQPVRAGTENIQLYYRYIPYEGPSTTTGTAGQPSKQPSGASDTEAKKTNTGEKKAEAGQAAKEPSATTGTSGQTPASSGTQAATVGENTQPSKGPKTECPMSGGQKPPVKKPEKDTGEFPSGDIPSFCQVDVNGDHYVTKDELQNFPELLRVFDKVDAGKDGRLEQHEFQNLEMETKREGEIS
jgi:hypothetical protein